MIIRNNKKIVVIWVKLKHKILIWVKINNKNKWNLVVQIKINIYKIIDWVICLIIKDINNHLFKMV